MKPFVKSACLAPCVTLAAGMGFAGGMYDWFLPADRELDAMYAVLHKKGPGGFARDLYWSSTNCGSCFARMQSFAGGDRGDDDKHREAPVRPARAF